MGHPRPRRSDGTCVTVRVRHDLRLQNLARLWWAAATGGYCSEITTHGFTRYPARAVRSAVARHLEWNGQSLRTHDDLGFTDNPPARCWADEHADRANGFDPAATRARGQRTPPPARHTDE
jgi:hypothetical protein